jgi:AcrR family transcriptional regulator
MSAPSTVERRPGRPRRADVDAAILDAAIDELEEHGYANVSVEGVAQRAGVAKTTVYRRWPGKDELMLDAIGRLKGPVVTEPPGHGLREDLLFLGERMRASWSNGRHARVMRQLAAEGSANPQLYRDFRDRLVGPRRAATLAVLRRGVEQGLIRDDVDLRWVAELIVAPVMLAVLTHRPPVSRAQHEFVIDTILCGIAP